MGKTSEFGNRVKARRIELGISQEMLAEIVGYKHKTSISKIENGLADCGQSMIVKLANALHTTPGYLVDGDGAKQQLPTSNELGVDSLNDKEQALIRNFRLLNDEWQDKVLNDLETTVSLVSGDSSIPKMEDAV